MSRTAVFVHAHPDDEALLTAGTMAKAAAQGHRVVLVVATDGALGLAGSAYTAGGELAAHRLAELHRSAEALGVARVVDLGYADSGMVGDVPPDPPGRRRLLNVPVAEAAQALARILDDENATVVTSYDANGGYGHRDHVRVHEIGLLAAELAGTPRHLQATVPRDLIARTVDLVGRVHRFPPEFDASAFHRAFSPAAAITHRISVRRFAAAKRAAMAAHASQASSEGGGERTLAAFLRIPDPLFGLVFGREWFVEVGRNPAGRAAQDIFEGL